MEVPVVQSLSSQEMDTATRVQIMDETDCISHSTNTLGEGMNPIILPPAMGKQQDRLCSSALVRKLVQGKENSEFKPVKLRLKKLTLCHILPERRGWVNSIMTTYSVLWKIALLSISVFLPFYHTLLSFRISLISWPTSRSSGNFDKKKHF